MRFGQRWQRFSLIFLLAFPQGAGAWVGDCRPAPLDAPVISVVSGSLLAGSSGSQLAPGGMALTPKTAGLSMFRVLDHDDWPVALFPPVVFSKGSTLPFFRRAASLVGGTLEVVRGSLLPEFSGETRLGGGTVSAAMTAMSSLFPQEFHARWDPVRRVLRVSGAMRIEARLPGVGPESSRLDVQDAGALLSSVVRSFGGHEVAGAGEGGVRFSVDRQFLPDLSGALAYVEASPAALVLDVWIFERSGLLSVPEGVGSGGYVLSEEVGSGRDGDAGLAYQIHAPPGVEFGLQGPDLLSALAVSGRRVVLPEPPVTVSAGVDPRTAAKVSASGCGDFYQLSASLKGLASYLPPFWVAFGGFSGEGYAQVSFGLGESAGVAFHALPGSVALLSFRGRVLSGRESRGLPGVRVPAFTALIRFRERRAAPGGWEG